MLMIQNFGYDIYKINISGELFELVCCTYLIFSETDMERYFR